MTLIPMTDLREAPFEWDEEFAPYLDHHQHGIPGDRLTQDERGTWNVLSEYVLAHGVPEPSLVSLDDLHYNVTNGLRLDVVRFYLEHPDGHYDVDGWFGNTHPVVFRLPRMVVADGSHRFAAAFLRGDTTMLVHLV